jgi:hypothetical protein
MIKGSFTTHIKDVYMIMSVAILVQGVFTSTFCGSAMKRRLPLKGVAFQSGRSPQKLTFAFLVEQASSHSYYHSQ